LQRWCNEFLKRRGIQINDLFQDLQDGLVLINLIEILTHPKTVGRHNAKPRIAVAKIENLSIALKFLQAEGIVLVNVGAEDIHAGNSNIILGLIWTLILRYQISLGDNNDQSSVRDELLEWVRSKIGPKTPYNYDIQGFTKDWNDGRALAALVDSLSGGGFPNHRELPVNDRRQQGKNCQEGIDRSFNLFEVPKLLDGEDMANPKIDQNSVMTYISYFRNLDPSKIARGPPPKQPGDDAKHTRAYGPGLQREGLLQMQPAEFKVDAPADTEEKLEVRVIGPEGDFLPADKVQITPKSHGKWECVYHPDEPGEYKVRMGSLLFCFPNYFVRFSCFWEDSTFREASSR
jgi:filamin